MSVSAKKMHAKTLRMAQLAVLLAVMLIFAFTPLGYLPIGVFEITLMVFPVAIGTIALGPAAGAFLGGVFGITSFIKFFTDPIGAEMVKKNFFGVLMMSIVARILCGWLSGLIFQALKKIDRTKLVAYYIAALSTALFNTVFYVGFLMLFFWHDTAIIGLMMGGEEIPGLWAFIVGMVGLNGIVEGIINFVIGGSVAKVVVRFVNRAE